MGTTPIVQSTTTEVAVTLVANSDTTVSDAPTYDRHTMAQVVKALLNAGILT